MRTGLSRTATPFLALVLVLLLEVYSTSALRCFTCDNSGSGEACITNPASVIAGSSTCQSPNDEYCYTTRLEEENKLTLNRGCCRVMDNSPVCPPGATFQILENDIPPYTKYMTRCTGDICNDSEGDNGNGQGNNDGGGVLVVDGKVPKGYKPPSTDTSGATSSVTGTTTMMAASLAVTVVAWMRQQ